MSCEYIFKKGKNKDSNCNLIKIDDKFCYKHAKYIYKIDTCNICLEKGNVVSACKYNHNFHIKCIKRWGRIKDFCPVCRTKITSYYVNRKQIEKHDAIIRRQLEISDREYAMNLMFNQNEYLF